MIHFKITVYYAACKMHIRKDKENVYLENQMY